MSTNQFALNSAFVVQEREMRERRVRVCARSVCDDDDAQNGEKSRRGVKGMFCKSSARVAFVLLWRLKLRFFQNEREKREIFTEKGKKREIFR